MTVNAGVVYTRDWVVELILDMVGYVPAAELWSRKAVEPSCGEGSFLCGMVRRLIASAKRDAAFSTDTLSDSILAFDLDPLAVESSRRRVRALLVSAGMEPEEAGGLADNWVRCGDYLLEDGIRADYVIGNPPYLRSTDIPKQAREEYCRLYSTMTRGCDIYVAFIQHGLDSLSDDGRLCFICADRWLQNQYGKNLRRYISALFHLSAIVKMHEVDAFEQQVSAYPAIVLIDRSHGRIRYAECDAGFSKEDAAVLAKWISSDESACKSKRFEAGSLATPKGDEPLPLISPAKAEVVASLSQRFPAIEETDVSLTLPMDKSRGFFLRRR